MLYFLEELRPYFSLPKVMDGLFGLAKTLFDIDIEAADGLAPVWNDDVRFYRFRPSEKMGGAWMGDVVARSRAFARDVASARLPPSLMTFREVETVFHEFGHALQHTLTKEDESLVSGMRGIEWDAIELPSQFMENWYLRQILYASTDLELHENYIRGGSESIFDVWRRVSEKTQVIAPLPEDRFLCYFNLIFARGYEYYAAGYYCYMWGGGDVGLDNEEAIKEIGHKFRDTVLALGGGKPPLEVFVQFRGREPSPEALLRHHGLLTAAAVSV
ncbi:hypothetical protein MKX01_006409 [Papaver californicum]|nr:hypothetical protein MKX01_006409 [Papaver californicum]